MKTGLTPLRFSLSLWERAGVRGSWGATPTHSSLHPFSTVSPPRRSQDPLTPTLSRREREQAGA